MITTVVALLAPLWLPMLTTFAYAFVIRRRLANPQTADKSYWFVYFGGLILAVVGFVLEIFGWHIELLYRLLWLVFLGIPMLMAVFVMTMSAIMIAGNW